MSDLTMSDLNEPILPDDYPIYGSYLYVVDGKVIASNWRDITARELRLRMEAKEVRRCDIGGRAALEVKARKPCGECHLQPEETCDICGALETKTMTEYGDVLAEWRKDAADLTAQLRDYQARVIPAETRVVALEAALLEIAGSDEYTTGDGHAKCIAIARAALEAKP